MSPFPIGSKLASYWPFPMTMMVLITKPNFYLSSYLKESIDKKDPSTCFAKELNRSKPKESLKNTPSGLLTMFWIVSVLFLALPSLTVQCSMGTWKADPTDCGKFRMCVLGREMEFKCPGKTVTNQMMQACVPEGSFMDTCSKKQSQSMVTEKAAPMSPKLPVTTVKTEKPATTKPTTEKPKVDPYLAMCSGTPSAVLPHPGSCAKSVECSMVMKGMVGVFECPFPTLWNTETKRCDNPATVKCGGRQEPKDACEYDSNSCVHSSHCVPCEVRFPSCKGRPDGINAWSGRERTPYFVVCENERLVRQGKCTYEENSHIVFDPIERACVRL